MLPQVTFRGLLPSAHVMDIVCRKARKLNEVAPIVRGCHVVIEASARGSQRPVSYRVCLQLSGDVEATRRNTHTESDNLHVALRDAFRAATRQLEPKRDRHARTHHLGITLHG
jgi:hypothetical protein